MLFSSLTGPASKAVQSCIVQRPYSLTSTVDASPGDTASHRNSFVEVICHNIFGFHVPFLKRILFIFIKIDITRKLAV